MPVKHDDGGRAAVGFKGKAGDCVVRAVAIAAERPYMEVYEALSGGMSSQRNTKRGKARSSARTGVNVTRKWFKDYMHGLGWKWVPTMGIGTGCKVHLVAGELPMGRLIVSISKHYLAVIDGVIHDTQNEQRTTFWYRTGSTEVQRVSERCVYGYWVKA